MAKPDAARRPSLASQAGQAVIWNTLFLPAKLIAEIGVNLLQLNLLSVAAVGTLALIRSAVGAVGVWVDLGIERALPKFIPEVERESGRAGVRELIGRVMAVKMAVLLVFAAGLWALRGRFLGSLTHNVQGMEKLSTDAQASLLAQIANNGWFFILAIVLLLVLGAFYDVLMAYLTSYFRQRASNTISLANALLLPLLISAALLLGWDITGVIFAMVATAVVGVILAAWRVWHIARVSQPQATATIATQPYIRRFVPYSALSYFFNLSDLAASQWFAVFLVGSLRDAAILWTAVNLVRQVLTYLVTPIVGLQVPLFTRARAGEGGTIEGAVATVNRILLLMLLPGGVALVLLAHPLVLAQYPKYVDATPAIMILTPLLFVEALLATSQNALMVAERYPPIIVSRLLAFVSIPLLLFLAPRYGAVGASVALGTGRVLAGLVVFVAGYRSLNLRFPWAFARQLAISSAAMGAVLLPLTWLLPQTVPETGALAIRLTLFVATLAISAMAGIVFLIVFRLLGGLDARDRQQLAATRLPFKRLVLRVL